MSNLPPAKTQVMQPNEMLGGLNAHGQTPNALECKGHEEV